MALTIAVGFVVDDAIVVVENIYRHIEDGEPPCSGRAEGRGRNRLHRRFDQPARWSRCSFRCCSWAASSAACSANSPHRDGRDRRLGLRVADADADDVLALPAGREHGTHGRLYRVIESGFDAMLASIGARSTSCCATSRSRWRVLRHAGAHRRHVHLHPEGLLPDPGHRHDLRLRRGRRRTSPARDDAAAAGARPTSCAMTPMSRRRLVDRRTRQATRRNTGRFTSCSSRATSANRCRCADHRPAAAASSPSPGSGRVSAAGAGHQCRRAARARRLTSTRCRTPTSTSSTSGRRSRWRS